MHLYETNTLNSDNSYVRSWFGNGAVNTNTGVTHTIPLRARIVGTGGPIVAGPFNTSVIMVIRYP